MRIGSQLIASMLFSADTDCFKGGGKGLVRRASRKGEGRRKGSRREGEMEKGKRKGVGVLGIGQRRLEEVKYERQNHLQFFL